MKIMGKHIARLNIPSRKSHLDAEAGDLVYVPLSPGNSRDPMTRFRPSKPYAGTLCNDIKN
jgi:hypothetical protein